MKFKPGEIDTLRFYGYMIGSIVPRPIAFVSTLSAEGKRNLAPFSFFTVASVDPPVVCFSPLIRGDLEKKDTVKNIQATKDFVLNTVTEELAAQMNQTANETDQDEWELSHLTPVPSELVKPPRVAESPVHMECRLREIISFGDNYLAGNLVLGDVLMIDVNDSVISDFGGLQLIDPDKLKGVGRMAGAAYARTRDRFDLERPMARPYVPKAAK